METNNRRSDLSLSFFIIKPEALERSNDIIKSIESHSSLRVVSQNEIILSEDDIDSIYSDDTQSELMRAIKKHLIGKKVLAGIVCGQDAVTLFQNVCGAHYDPEHCAEGTLRREFGLFDAVTYDGVPYFLNAIHKASENEIGAALLWYEKKFDLQEEKLLSQLC